MDHLALEPHKRNLNKKEQRTARVKARLNRNAFKESIMLGEIDVALLFQTDTDLLEMRQSYPQVFFDVFNEGFNYFLKGDFKRARKLLMQIAFIKKDDGPTKELMDFMKETNFETPKGWPGYRLQE